MASEFPQRDVDISDNLLAGAAVLSPGFADDLSTWRLAVFRDGRVVQELSRSSGGEADRIQQTDRHRSVAENDLANIVDLAIAVGFGNYKQHYSATLEDLPTTSITLNAATCSHHVVAYGADVLAQQGCSDMRGYLRLWNALIALAPDHGVRTRASLD